MARTVKTLPGSMLMALSDITGSNPLVEDYLEHLAAPLIGLVPYEQRSALRLETHEHLEVRILQIEREGCSVKEATVRAIKGHGPAHRIADSFARAWFEAAASTWISRRIGRANTIAFSRFVLAHLGYTLVLECFVYFPSNAAYSLPMSPANMRRLLPEPFPLPDHPWAVAIIYAYPVMAPILAGWLTGLAVPVGAPRAVYNAVLPLALFSFLAGAMMLPATTGILFGLAQVAIWLPLGALSAHVGACVGRIRRMNQEVGIDQ